MRASAPARHADPPLLGVPPLEAPLSPSNCSYGADCKFPAAESTVQLKTCSLCGVKKAHHLCCIEHALLRHFAGDLNGCFTNCFDCTAFRGVASGATDGVQLQAYYEQINWAVVQEQNPRTLAALMSWPPRPLLFRFAKSNSLCQQCDLGDAEESDDAATLLPCSFCNLSYHNSAGCLGKAGGAILSEREAKNEEHEWACPPCWAGALAKARRATQDLVATRVVVGKKTSQKKSKKASKK
jgi:hypothetical protein